MLSAEEIRSIQVGDEITDRAGGTGEEEQFKNFMLQEIAAQLAELVHVLNNLKG